MRDNYNLTTINHHMSIFYCLCLRQIEIYFHRWSCRIEQAVQLSNAAVALECAEKLDNRIIVVALKLFQIQQIAQGQSCASYSAA